MTELVYVHAKCMIPPPLPQSDQIKNARDDNLSRALILCLMVIDDDVHYGDDGGKRNDPQVQHLKPTMEEQSPGSIVQGKNASLTIPLHSLVPRLSTHISPGNEATTFIHWMKT